MKNEFTDKQNDALDLVSLAKIIINSNNSVDHVELSKAIILMDESFEDVDGFNSKFEELSHQFNLFNDQIESILDMARHTLRNED